MTAGGRGVRLLGSTCRAGDGSARLSLTLSGHQRFVGRSVTRAGACRADEGLHVVRTERLALFDHLVGAAEQRNGKRQTERLRGLEVDDQLDFCRLLDRKVGGLLSFENPTGVDTG